RFRGGGYFAIAGRYLLLKDVLANPDGSAATIFDRLSGARVTNAKGALFNLTPPGDGTLQSDGKVIYQLAGPDGPYLAWRSPAAPEPHRIAEPGSRLAEADGCAGRTVRLREDTIL